VIASVSSETTFGYHLSKVDLPTLKNGQFSDPPVCSRSTPEDGRGVSVCNLCIRCVLTSSGFVANHLV